MCQEVLNLYWLGLTIRMLSEYAFICLIFFSIKMTRTVNELHFILCADIQLKACVASQT